MASEQGRGAQVRLDDTARALARGGNTSRLIDNIRSKLAAEQAGTAPSGLTVDGSLGNGVAADDEVLTPGGAAGVVDAVVGLPIEIAARIAGDIYTPAGTGAYARATTTKLAELPVSLEDFYSAVDADWTNAFARARATGRPIRLGERSYDVTGQIGITTNLRLYGTRGLSILRRVGQVGGAFVSISAAVVVLDGVTFDANSAGAYAGWNVLLPATTVAQRVSIRDCRFTGATDTSLGYGLVIGGNGDAAGAFYEASYHVVDCEFDNNRKAGLWVTSADTVNVTGCRAHDNTESGIRFDYDDASFLRKGKRGIISNNHCWDNAADGIALGSSNKTNGSGSTVRWGNGNDNVMYVVVNGNHCWRNGAYGLSLCGAFISATDNHAHDNTSAAILLIARDSSITGGSIQSTAAWVIDSGASTRCIIQGVRSRGGGIGISVGANLDVQVLDCEVSGFSGSGISTTIGESDGAGVAFQQLGARITISRNKITKTAGTKAIYIPDGIPDCTIIDNEIFFDTTGVSSGNQDIEQNLAIVVLAPTYVITGNRYNGQCTRTRNPSGGGAATNQIMVPNWADEINITAGTVVTGIYHYEAQQYRTSPTWVTVTAGGSGFTPGAFNANVTGGSGSGGVVRFFVDQSGTILFGRINSFGSGYVTATAVVDPNIVGSGATATVNIGAPMPDGRRVRVWTLQGSSGPLLWTRGANPAVIGGVAGNFAPLEGSTLSLVSYYNQWRVDSGAIGRLGRGTGTPESAIFGTLGDEWQRTDGDRGTTLYFKASGSGSTTTGWLPVGTADVAQAVVMTDAGSVAMSDTANFLLMTGAGTIPAYSVALPATPSNAQRVTLTTNVTVTALTITASHAIDGPATTINAAAPLSWVYNLAGTRWMRI